MSEILLGLAAVGVGVGLYVMKKSKSNNQQIPINQQMQINQQVPIQQVPINQSKIEYIKKEWLKIDPDLINRINSKITQDKINRIKNTDSSLTDDKARNILLNEILKQMWSMAVKSAKIAQQNNYTGMSEKDKINMEKVIDIDNKSKSMKGGSNKKKKRNTKKRSKKKRSTKKKSKKKRNKKKNTKKKFAKRS